MSDVFTASNEFTFEPDGRGGLTVWSSPEQRVRFAPVPREMMVALREFFGQEQGVWKDPETGKTVVRVPECDDEDGRAVLVVGEYGYVWEKLAAGVAATNYFKAHPVLEPKPWHSARPGEVWNVKVEDWDTERCFVFAPFEGPFRFQTETETHIAVDDERIVSAVRIYPEEGEQ